MRESMLPTTDCDSELCFEPLSLAQFSSAAAHSQRHSSLQTVYREQAKRQCYWLSVLILGPRLGTPTKILPLGLCRSNLGICLHINAPYISDTDFKNVPLERIPRLVAITMPQNILLLIVSSWFQKVLLQASSVLLQGQRHVDVFSFHLSLTHLEASFWKVVPSLDMHSFLGQVRRWWGG